MNDVYSFSCFGDYASKGIADAIKNFAPEDKSATVLCIGSDLILGDSLGPLVGTMLKKRGVLSYVYGSLTHPVTAKEILYAKNYVKKTHPNSFIIAIDAAIGEKNDVGIIKVNRGGLKPGLGVDKNLGKIGDVSIIGIVAPRSVQNYSLFNATRLNLVYTMSERIANGLDEFLRSANPFSQKQGAFAI